MEIKTKNRESWVDWLRVAACFMVMIVHSTEPFYLGGDGALILTESDGVWAAIFDSLVRSCVPLFVIASSYLQFPLHYSAGDFIRKRATRILIPFALWSIVYACVWGEPMENLKNLVFNFNYAAGHLWFVYMLLGLYLMMPLLSPWAEKVSRKELLIYLAIWAFTTMFPMLRDFMCDGNVAMVYGPSGLPRQALFPLWGEASWNSYGTFYYVSGMVGYMLIGLYFRRFVGLLSWKKTIAWALPLFVVGFAITAGGFLRRALGGEMSGSVALAVQWETTWTFDSTGVAMMAIALIFLFRKLNSNSAFYNKILLPISNASYGMYLMHMLYLLPIVTWLRNYFGIGEEASLGVLTMPLTIVLSAMCSFGCCALTAVLLKRIPWLGRYIVG